MPVIGFLNIASPEAWTDYISAFKQGLGQTGFIEGQNVAIEYRWAHFHTGSHSNDVERLSLIIDEAAAYRPDLALFGGDYVNLQLLGGGRVPPRTTAAILSRLETPLGRFAVLGNHDYVYDQYEVANALEDHAITVLDHSSRAVRFQDGAINVLGIPDAHVMRPEAYSVLRGLCPERPTIV